MIDGVIGQWERQGRTGRFPGMRLATVSRGRRLESHGLVQVACSTAWTCSEQVQTAAAGLVLSRQLRQSAFSRKGTFEKALLPAFNST